MKRVGYLDMGRRNILEAVHLVALLAIKVDMHVVYGAMTFSVAYLIFGNPASVLYHVYDIFFDQERKHAQNA